jgi:hypothetical protein
MIGLRDEDGRKGAVHHRAVEVERIAERQHEGRNPRRGAEAVEAFQRLGIGRLRRRRGEGNHQRLADQAQQMAVSRPEHDEADHDQDRPQDQQREIEAAHEHDQLPQYAEAVLRYGRHDRRPHRDRREQHHITGHFQHDVGEVVDQREHRLGTLGQRAERHREKHREHHDLQNFVLRHRIRDRGRDQMRQEFFDRESRDRQAGRLTLVGQRAGEIGARLQQIDHDKAEQQRDEGSADEPAHRLGEHPSELGAGSHMRDTADQGREHQRRNDHLDQAQEQHRNQVDGRRDLDAAVGHVIVDHRAHHDAERHRDQNELREPVGHSCPRFLATGGSELGRFHNRCNTDRRSADLPECFCC